MKDQLNILKKDVLRIFLEAMKNGLKMNLIHFMIYISKLQIKTFTPFKL